MLGNLMALRFIIREKVNSFIHEEKGASDIVAVVLLVAVAVAAAWLFREKLLEIIGSIFDGASESAQSISSQP